MEFSRELLFFFSALGAFNGLVLSLYFLFWIKPKHISNYFLGGLLMALSIRIGKSVFFYFNEDLAEIYLQIGLSGCFFIGPFLYFYLRSILEPEGNIAKTWRYHFVLMLVIIIGIGVIYPYESEPELWWYYITDGIYYQWMVYLMASALLFRRLYRKVVKESVKLDGVDIWTISIYLGNVIIWIAYMSFPYVSYIIGALTFTFMLYLLVLTVIFNKKKDNILFKKQSKYGDKKIESHEAAELLERLKKLMIDEQLYKDPDLSLPEVAKKLNIITHRLSQLINDNLNKTFPLFINEYRVHEAKEMLKTNDKFTLEAIGYECGFNSKSTFYTAFKKHTGTTPAKYQNNLS